MIQQLATLYHQNYLFINKLKKKKKKIIDFQNITY
jgi:hypothetical protein